MSDKQKENIVQFAVEKMCEVGIRSVSIDDICHELGISKKTFYVYFESKDQLVREMLALLEQKLENKMLREVGEKDVIQVLQEWGKMARRTEKDFKQTPPIVYDLQKYYPNLYVQHKEHLCEMMYRNLVPFIQKGQHLGVFRKELDADITAQLFAFAHYCMMETIQNYPKRRGEMVKIAKQGIDVMIQGILATPLVPQNEEDTKGNTTNPEIDNSNNIK